MVARVFILVAGCLFGRVFIMVARCLLGCSWWVLGCYDGCWVFLVGCTLWLLGVY